MATYASRGEKLEDVSVPPESIKAISRRGDHTGNIRAGVTGKDTLEGLSQFWQDCPMSAIRNDPDVGYMMEDAFVNVGLSGVITTIISNAGTGRYLVFGGATAAFSPNQAVGGGLTMTLTDNNQPISITTKQTPFQITSGYGNLWFEARIKMSSIVTNELSFLVGLMDTVAQDATHPLTAAGAIADQNFVGYHFPEANTTAFDTSYRANGVAAVEVNSDVGTLEEGIYIKLGFRFDTSNNLLSFYINGAYQAVQKVIPDATGTDFPADVTLAPVIALMTAVDTDETLTIDWWKCAQVYI